MAKGSNKAHRLARLREREARLAPFAHITHVAGQLREVRAEIEKLS